MLKLIFGCGYLGGRVALRWIEAGHEVAAVTRTAARAAELAQQGIRPIVADVTAPETLAGLPEARSVLFAVGYDRFAGGSIREVYVGGLQTALAALPSSVERFIYISSTGVFAQNDGSWLDEDSPCRPVREGGRACLEAEQLLEAHPLGRRSIVLRMAGIYGPGRIPRRADLEAGRPLSAPSEGLLNLIHVYDAADVVLAAEARAPLPRRYLVSDGQPVVRREYYEELARLLGTPPPRFATPDAASPAAERAASSKRISNARMLRELDVALAYPSYGQGLAAILRAEQG